MTFKEQSDIKVSQNKSGNYENMARIFPNDENYEDYQKDNLENNNEPDFSLLSAAVKNVIGNDNNYRVKHLTKKYLFNDRKSLQTSFVRKYEDALTLTQKHYEKKLKEKNNEIKNVKSIAKDTQAELNSVKAEIKDRDEKITDMEENLYEALSKILDFIARYEKNLLSYD